jgi:hypothetical protein
MARREEIVRRGREYAERNRVNLGEELGFGVHGIVFVAESQTEPGEPAVCAAIKVHEREADYCRERDVYLRLRGLGVNSIRGCRVPQLLRYDDKLWVLEMTVVTRPFVLDFAGAFLDQAPDFSDEVLADWRAEKQEQFGTRWPEVQAILRALEGYGIFLLDVTPNNISFGD